MDIKERIDKVNIELAEIEKEVGKHLFPSDVETLKKARNVLYRLYC